MAIGFPYPRYRASRTFAVSDQQLWKAVESAFEVLGWSYKEPWGQTFEARVPTTNWSYHHDFKASIVPGGVLQAESKSAYQEMFLDLGRNRRNVEKFFAAVSAAAGLEAHQRPA